MIVVPIRALVPILTVLLALFGCAKREPDASAAPPSTAVKSPARSLDANGARATIDRKVIRKAELSLTVSSPADAQVRITALVDREGGYVASAERTATDPGSSTPTVTLKLRVPSNRLTLVLAEIRRLGDGHRAETLGSEDVTEEYIDLDARLRAQEQLEEQFLAILKTATSVEAALAVHKEIASVRSEIERMKGRRQFLDREVAFSTVVLVLNAPSTESVSLSAFGRSISSAASDAVLVASFVVTAGIRLAGVLLPIALFIGLPLFFAVVGSKRWKERRRARSGLSVV